MRRQIAHLARTATHRAMSQQIESAPFTRAVINAMRRVYPDTLADKTWDNTGLLLETPFDAARRKKNSVLLTIDLTKAVADEAIERNVSIVVAYHPIIFRGLKAITLADTQQQSLMRLAAEGISVYSPHSALDAAPHGLGDWLADMLAGESVVYAKREDASASSSEDEAETSKAARGSSSAAKKQAGSEDESVGSGMLHHYPSQASTRSPFSQRISEDDATHDRSAIKPSNGNKIEGAGMGRVVRYKSPQPLQAVLDRITQGLGQPKAYLLAIPQGKQVNDITIKAAAVCAGSGGSLFSEAPADVDLFFTGELSHHEALAQIEKGKTVVCVMHSNSERGFLHQVLQPQLQDAIRHDWHKLRKYEKATDGLIAEVKEAYEDESVTVEVSERDRDPFGFVVT